MEYCTRIKSILDILTNIGAPFPERNLAIYVMNGLSQKYAHIMTTIRHQKPFPTFLEMRSMLTLKERSMKKEQTHLLLVSHPDNAFSPSVLNVEHQNRSQNYHRNNFGTQISGRGGGRTSRSGGRSGRSGDWNQGHHGRDGE
ncbi:hypothetical protein Lser_V15G07213 [Lactuca serriola]